MKSAWEWIRARALGLLAGLVAVLGAGWLYSYHRRRLGRLQDELAVERAQRKVAALDARREALLAREEDAAEQIAEVEAKRVQVQREAVSVAQDVRSMSDGEVAAAFRELYRTGRRRP